MNKAKPQVQEEWDPTLPEGKPIPIGLCTIVMGENGEECQEPAFQKCGWQNQFRIGPGGCGKLFCELHAFTVTGAKKPVCCYACEKSYLSDIKRTKYSIIGGVVVGFLIVLISIIVSFAEPAPDNKIDGEIVLDSKYNTSVEAEVEYLPVYYDESLN